MTTVPSIEDLQVMLKPFLNPRFLVMDDDRNDLEIVGHMLESLAVKFDTATSVPDAIKLLETNDYFLVLIDLKIPGLSGANLVGWISEHQPDVSSVILTGYPDAALLSDALKFGPLILMAKPLSLAWFQKLLLMVNLPQAHHEYASSAA